MFSYLPHDRSEFFTTSRYWEAVENFLRFELENDGEDITSREFLKGKKGKVYVINKTSSSSVLAGKEELEFFLAKFFPEISYKWGENIEEGIVLQKNQKIFWAEGDAYSLMKLERVFLNVLSRMSGIATQTSFIGNIIKDSTIEIAATRKTQWSYLDKKAVHIGGGLTHRMGLFDAMMIKENHQIIGDYDLNIEKFLKQQCKQGSPKFLEVEVETLEEFKNIFNLFWNAENTEFTKVIMLDNFSAEKIQETLKNYPSAKSRHEKNIFLEASGGINEENISSYKKSSVDVISIGGLTNNVSPIDFSMRAL